MKKPVFFQTSMTFITRIYILEALFRLITGTPACFYLVSFQTGHRIAIIYTLIILKRKVLIGWKASLAIGKVSTKTIIGWKPCEE